MKALVSTSQYLLHVDLSTKVVTPLEGDRPEYYGITWIPGEKELILSHSGLENESLIDIASYAQSEKGWLSAGKVDTAPFLSGPHQVLCASDGRVVCTNTGRNCLTIIDLAKPNSFVEVRLSGARWGRLSLDNITGDHINSVFERDGKLYVLAHGHSSGASLAVFSYPKLELISINPIKHRTGLHNIFVTKEGLAITCHSSAGALVDIREDRVLWEAGSNIYTRGLAISDDVVLVGESQMTGRDLRRSSLSGLWVICRKTWKALDHICLGPYGVVNEVRLIDVPDYAHHGKPLCMPDELLQSNMLMNISSERLASYKITTASNHIWKNFSLIFGSPNTLHNGGKKAPGDTLCLSTLISDKTKTIGFDYVLEGTTDSSHVSAIIGYHGNGGDTNMIAALLAPVENKATLSAWINQGDVWVQIPDINVPNLPVSGQMYIERKEHSIEVFINEKLVTKIKLQQGYDFTGLLGIRWIGSQVRPVEDSL